MTISSQSILPTPLEIIAKNKAAAVFNSSVLGPRT